MNTPTKTKRRPSLATAAAFRALYERSPIGIAELDDEGRFRRVNKALQAMLGRSEAELLALNFNDVTHADDLPACAARFGGLVRRETDHFEIEKRFLRKDGRIVWAHTIVTAVRSGERARGMIGMAVDVTERRLAQEELARLRLELEDRIKARTAEVEMYAYAASHDLSAPLRRILGFEELLEARAKGKLDAGDLDYLARIRRSAGAALKLVTDMLTLSRTGRESLPLEDVDLNAVLAEVKGELAAELEAADARLEAGPLPVLRANAISMHSILLNLISNAVKFRRRDRPAGVRLAARRDGAWVAISFADDGIGFEQAYAEKIFQPFLRLHASSDYEGSGIGLAICRRVAERCGGTLTAESEPGRGSTFTLRLPAAMLVR